MAATGGASTGRGGASSGGNTAGNGGTTAGAGGVIPGGGGTTVPAGGGTAIGGTSGGTKGSGGATGSGGAGKGGTSGGGGSTTSGGCDVWVASDGNDSNPGTESQPVATLAKGYDLLCPPVTGAKNGDPCAGSLTTMCIKSGTYKLSERFQLKKTRMGTASRVLKIQADPAATRRPILDFSSQPRLSCGQDPDDDNQRGIDLGADYFHIKGLEVMGSNDNCIIVQGSHNIVENCVVHDCADFGIAIGSGSGYTGSGTYNTIINCDSYHNYDPQCKGENADGFGAKKGSGDGNVFRGCRAWSDSDDGWDFYGWTSSISIENCWAFNIAMESAYVGSNSDGNGFKLGSDSSDGGHKLSNCMAFNNKKTGFTNNGGKNSTCTNCKSCSNGQSDTGVSGVTSGGCPSVSAAQGARKADGSLPDL
jgi:pectate disaccharide-lyase